MAGVSPPQSGQPFPHAGAADILARLTHEIFALEKAIIDHLRVLPEIRVTLWESLRRGRIGECEAAHLALAARFAEILERYESGDVLFKGLGVDPDRNAEEAARVVATFFQFRPGMEPLVSIIFRLMQYGDQLLASKRNTADFRTTALLAGSAIVISVIFGVSQAFY